VSKVHIADRNVEALAKASYAESSRFRRKAQPWRAPWPPRPEAKQVEPDDLILRATVEALRRAGVR
jgi:hypothetical protein